MNEQDWKCCGCGKPSPNRERVCDCPTNCVSQGNRSAWKVDPGARRLSETIRTRLLGVKPEDQDVVLEDADWNIILTALDGAAHERLSQIADIAEGSGTVNSLPHIAKIARGVA